MRKEFPDVIYPAIMTRDLTGDEKVAKLAHDIITDHVEAIYLAESIFRAPAPTPNKSARIYARKKVGMTMWVTVEASQAFFDAVERWWKEGEKGSQN